MTCVEAFLAGVVLSISAVVFLQQRDGGPSPVEQAKRDYNEGRIDEREFERRLDLHLDDRNKQIREVVTQVGNVGPETSKDIAREFESLAELRRADQAHLT